MRGQWRWMAALGIMVAVAGNWPAAAQQNQRQNAPARPAAPAPAQAPAAAQAPAQPVPTTPERTSASFGDWAVVCVSRPATATVPAGRACEMSMTVQDQRQQPVAIVALGRPVPGEPLKMVARVPVNVQVAIAARLVLEGEPGADMPFRFCAPQGCFAELELRDEALLRRLRARNPEQPGRIEWRDAAGNAAVIPLSFRGFTQAHDALGREGH